MTKRRRGLLPTTSEEYDLLSGLGLSQADLRDIDDLFLALKNTPARMLFFAVMRKVKRLGLGRRTPLQAPNGPMTPAQAKLGQVLDRVAEGATGPAGKGAHPRARSGP